MPAGTAPEMDYKRFFLVGVLVIGYWCIGVLVIGVLVIGYWCIGYWLLVIGVLVYWCIHWLSR